MDQSVFDAASFIDFDLDKGTINTEFSRGLALVPWNVLAALEPTESIVKVAREFGKNHGSDFKQKKETGQWGGDFEILAEHLGGTIATLGMGRLGIEIHGDALLFRVVSEPLRGGGNTIVCGFLAGYLEAITGYPFEVLVVQEDSVTGTKLLWAGNPDAASSLQERLEEGLEPMLALDELCERS